MRVVLKTGHMDGCSALALVQAGSWSSPWFVTGETRRGDSLGRSNGSTTHWMVLECNSPSDLMCPAVALIDEEELATAVHESLEGNS